MRQEDVRQLRSNKEFKSLRKRTGKREADIVVLLENIQYARNVASIFRTANAASVNELILTGITKKPPFGKDLSKASRMKEKHTKWSYHESTTSALQELSKNRYLLIAVEITNRSIDYRKIDKILRKNKKICFVFGNETYGITKETLSKCSLSMHIPMYGKGASLNVAVSVGVMLFSF